ncbi:MAG: hypothetical protein K0R47_4185 [Brevibacillus sp.]|nr:hypothetical protein [Brevibacillus sp.]
MFEGQASTTSGGRKVKVASGAVTYACLLSLFFVLAGFDFPSENRKATWLWHTELIASEPEEILSFSREQGVNLIYLQIDSSKKPAYYQSFIRDAHRAGVDVHALSGSPKWALKENREKVVALASWLLAYNQSVADEEKFTGLHLDIEPYLLPEWKTNQESVISQWMENVKAYVDLARQDPELEIGCDIPFWLDKIYLTDAPDTALSQWLIAQHDHVAIMSYRDRAEGPNSISALVPQELGWADDLGKKIMLGVETKQSNEGNFVSFYEEGAQYLNQELSKLPALMADHPSFGGIAVHSYEHWKVLKD